MTARKASAATSFPSTPAVAISAGNLLGDAFAGPSWDRWRAVLKAAYGEPLDATELTLFREVAERDPPQQRVKELWAIVGRRGGKDSIASAIATVAACGDYRQHLRPGERATVMCLAVDREQAKIVSRYICAYFAENPRLRPLVERETDDGLELRNGVEIVIATNNFRAVRGRTVVAVIFDEVSFWRSEESATPDTETYNAVLPAMVTIPGAMLIGITTAYRRKGLAFETWRRSYGKPDDDVLVIRATSRQFNEKLPQSVIDKAMEADPEAAAAEWLSEWRNDLSDFLDRELVESAVDVGVSARAPQPSASYFAFADPSGGRGASFAVAIAHADGGRVLLDALFERRSPFEPTATVAEVAALLRESAIGEVTGDAYAAGWVVEAFSKAGIRYTQSERDRSAVYRDTLPLFTSGRARLLDDTRLKHQFVALERRTGRGGKDSVSRPPGGKDDLCNAAAGALVIASAEIRSSLIPAAALRPAAKADDDLGFVYSVRAVLWVDITGMAAWAIFVLSPHQPQPLTIADLDLVPWNAALPDLIAAKLDALAELARSRNVRSENAGIDVVFYVQQQLIDAADSAMQRAFAERGSRIDVGRRWVGVQEIDAAYLADPVKLALGASVHWNAGRVRIASDAGERSRSVPLMGTLAIRPGSRVDDDPLRVCLFLGVALALDQQPSHTPPMIPSARISAA
jgi:hypothetical protein